MDERLLIEAAQKDPSEFAALYDEHFERVYAYVVRRVRDRHQAQDITSEVFQRALANLKRFEWRGAPFAAWLYRIASNAIADHFQRQSREVSRPDGDSMRIDSEDIERRALLFRLVGRLPDEQRRVVVMRFVEGRTSREIAERIGRSEGAVKQLQWRALQKLRADING